MRKVEEAGPVPSDLLAQLEGLPEVGEDEPERPDPDDDAEMLDGARVPALFSAYMDTETITFHIGDCEKESSAELRPMNGDQLMRYRDMIQRWSQTEGPDGNPRMIMEVNRADTEVILLKSTVIAMTIYYVRKVQGTARIETYLYPKMDRDREKFFRDLHPELRERLVDECKRVNGLSPLPV